MKKNIKLRVILSVGLSLLLLVYVIYQIYVSHTSVVETEYALDYTYHQTIPMQGFVVRNEEVINQKIPEGIISYCQPNGSKISSGHLLAKVFSNSEQAATQTKIDELDNTINNLSELQMTGTQIAADAQVLDTRIDQSIYELLTIAGSGKLNNLESVSNDLLQLLNKKQIALGNAGNFDTYIENLKAEKSKLESGMDAYTEIYSEQSGYFIGGDDGYETVIDYQDILATDLNKLNHALNFQASASGSVGKIIASNEWYILSSISQVQSQSMKLGDFVEVTVPLLSDDVYQCEVMALNVDYIAKQTVLVLKCSQMNDEIATARKENFELRTNSHQGLRINQAALRVVDGITGVYVVDGISASFKPVEILYSDNDFVICKYDPQKTSGIKQYDEVIIEGIDLYDGKVIR